MHHTARFRFILAPFGRSAAPPLAVAIVLGLVVATTSRLAAQETGGFDLDRALLSDTTRWRPFEVAQTRPLEEALAEGRLHEDTPLLVFEGPTGAVALLVEQMSYHHVAQGAVAGEPWMVSF